MNNLLAILLPHYNNSSGLQLTLQSLLKETEKFTVFIFDDGSDNFIAVKDIVAGYKNKFEIILNQNKKNLGITATLNLGLQHIINLNKFDLVARLDAGDICVNNRFAHQVEMFSKDSDLALIGTWVKFVDLNREKIFEFKPPSSDSKLKKVMHLYNPFVHPSVMFKTDVVNTIGYYPENYTALEDHAYFFKIVKKFKVSIVEKVLLEYEINPLGISSLKRKEQTISRIKLLLNEFEFGIYPVIGLIRAGITFIIPQKVLIFIKKNLFYK